MIFKVFAPQRLIECLFKGRRILAPGGIAFAAPPFVFAGYSGSVLQPRVQTPAPGGMQSAWGGGDYSPRAAPQRGHHFAQPRGKDLREIQELLRHKSIRTTVRYTNLSYEQTRQTGEALRQALEWQVSP